MTKTNRTNAKMTKIRTSSGWKQFLIGVVLCYVVQNVNFGEVYKYLEKQLSKKDVKVVEEIQPFETSGWCNGDTVQTRMCHFKNLCFQPKTGRFIMFLSENSTFMGFNSSHST